METCCLCRVKGPGKDGQGEFLRPRTINGKRVFVHEYCALFSPKVYQDETGALVNVGNEIHRGNALVRGGLYGGSTPNQRDLCDSLAYSMVFPARGFCGSGGFPGGGVALMPRTGVLTLCGCAPCPAGCILTLVYLAS